MARRGDVLAVKRRLGFGSEGRVEHFVVLQADVVQAALDTTIVVPLDDDLPLYEGDPLVVSVSAKEAGTRRGQVALVAHVLSVRIDRFEPTPVGKLKLVTLRSLEASARVILDLP